MYAISSATATHTSLHPFSLDYLRSRAEAYSRVPHVPLSPQRRIGYAATAQGLTCRSPCPPLPSSPPHTPSPIDPYRCFSPPLPSSPPTSPLLSPVVSQKSTKFRPPLPFPVPPKSQVVHESTRAHTRRRRRLLVCPHLGSFLRLHILQLHRTSELLGNRRDRVGRGGRMRLDHAQQSRLRRRNNLRIRFYCRQRLQYTLALAGTQLCPHELGSKLGWRMHTWSLVAVVRRRTIDSESHITLRDSRSLSARLTEVS